MTDAELDAKRIFKTYKSNIETVTYFSNLKKVEEELLSSRDTLIKTYGKEIAENAYAKAAGEYGYAKFLKGPRSKSL